MNEYWHNTAKEFKFFMLNGNTLIFILLWAVHMRLWTAGLALFASILFTFLESKGHTLNSSYSLLKLYLSLFANKDNTVKIEH